MNIIEKINKLRNLIEYHNKLYYGNDQLVEELNELEAQYPEYFSEKFPTQHVGGTVKRELRKVQHDVPVISLQDAFSKEEVYSFVEKVCSQISNPKFTVEKKINGLTLILRYRNGVLEEAITRGNGQFDESVYENALVIKTIPKKIPTTLSYLEVRGEVYMSNKAFEEVLEREKNKGDKKYKTPRNLPSGTLIQLDSSIVNRWAIAYKYSPE